MKPYYSDDTVTLYLGDTLEVLRTLPDESVDCVVTSPPYYGLRDYGVPGQYGLEESPAAYVERMRGVFAEVRRVLAGDGTCWINLGDSYASPPPGRSARAMSSSTLDSQKAAGTLRESVRSAGVDRAKFLPEKNLLGIPWRVALALQDDGWILRNEIIWHKPNAMPESVRDRLSNRHEHLFMLVKKQRYWFDLDAIREPHQTVYADGTVPHWSEWPTNGASSHRGGHYHMGQHPRGRNPGDVWEIATSPYAGAHFATFPPRLPLRCILAGCKPGGVVLDPFSGSGTTGAAARRAGRRYVGIDINPSFHDLAVQRFAQGVLL